MIEAKREKKGLSGTKEIQKEEDYLGKVRKRMWRGRKEKEFVTER